MPSTASTAPGTPGERAPPQADRAAQPAGRRAGPGACPCAVPAASPGTRPPHRLDGLRRGSRRRLRPRPRRAGQRRAGCLRPDRPGVATGPDDDGDAEQLGSQPYAEGAPGEGGRRHQQRRRQRRRGADPAEGRVAGLPRPSPRTGGAAGVRAVHLRRGPRCRRLPTRGVGGRPDRRAGEVHAVLPARPRPAGAVAPARGRQVEGAQRRVVRDVRRRRHRPGGRRGGTVHPSEQG
jgi:hypothetical protein